MIQHQPHSRAGRTRAQAERTQERGPLFSVYVGVPSKITRSHSFNRRYTHESLLIEFSGGEKEFGDAQCHGRSSPHQRARSCDLAPKCPGDAGFLGGATRCDLAQNRTFLRCKSAVLPAGEAS
jgi:hypothetical protein